MVRVVVVLGGAGNFGRRIVERLAADRESRVFVAGRNMQRASEVAQAIGGVVEPLQVDCHTAQFAAQLRDVNASVVVHTAGPFQAQSHTVPQACIEAGAHYIDLADAREYVCGVRTLDEAARRAGVLVVSGASSLPALSSAVVDELSAAFSQIDSIEHGISSGARPPGEATMNGVLGYVGKPFRIMRRGSWCTAHGWQELTLQRYPSPIGRRWLACCDVPDLELFPQRYPGVRSVVFRAGVGFASSTLAIWCASWMVRAGILKSLQPHVPRLHRMASALQRFGSKWSAMHVTVRGRDHQKRLLARTWTLLAGDDDGPHIPTFPAIALMRKILRDDCAVRGALPCMGLLTTAEILDVGRGLNLRTIVA